MSRVALESISSLTFYQDALTKARRTSPIAQLVCIGKPCALYQPEVVHCKNIGGSGTDVDWKCEADLPSSLRFGKVEVGCEGWNGPGDPYVLKGSCSLEYRLVEVPGSLRDKDSGSQWFASFDLGGLIFMIIWVGLLVWMLYSFISSCFRSSGPRRLMPPSSSSPYRGGGGGGGPSGGYGGGPGAYPGGGGADDAPPPYSKSAPSGSAQQHEGWRPGFWTGAALGALGQRLFGGGNGNSGYHNGGHDRFDDMRQRRSGWTWDWQSNREPFRSTSDFGGRARPTFSRDEDRGEGSSRMGAMRSSTGYGRSNVR